MSLKNDFFAHLAPKGAEERRRLIAGGDGPTAVGSKAFAVSRVPGAGTSGQMADWAGGQWDLILYHSQETRQSRTTGVL